MEWNILATAYIRKERFLLRTLREFGDFKGSGFRDVLIGTVEDRDAFFEAVEQVRHEHPERIRSLSQAVPIETTFSFEVADLRQKLLDALAPYREVLENGNTFYVRVKRRGHKGELSSLDLEKELSEFIISGLEKMGRHVEVDFEDPDKILIIETIGNRAGIGIITRTMKERYPFIRVK